MTVPMAMAVPIAYVAYNQGRKILAGNVKGAKEAMTGYTDSGFSVGILMETYGPIVAGAVVHKAASYLGVNRMIGRSGIPFFRV